MELISIAAATPGQVEAFRYQDGGMERNIQDELDARLDHIYVARVVNWPIANESEWGLSGWTPADSLLLYLSSNNLFVTKGLAYMGGRHLEAGGELFSTADPATDTYYVYLKYTFSSDTFEYEYATTKPTDTNLVKHLMLGTANWSTVTKFWTNAVDLRASNTSLGAPATVSGSDAGAIFTVENTGAGDGLLVKNSDAVIGESATPQQLIIQGDGTKALTIYNSANSVEMVCSAANQLKVQTIAGAAAEIFVDSLDTGGPVLDSTGLNMGTAAIVGATATDTINGIVISSGVIGTGTWQATVIAKAYLAAHNHTAAGEGGDYAWADITALSDISPLSTGTATAGTSTEVSRYDHRHAIGSHNHDTVYYKETEQHFWPRYILPVSDWNLLGGATWGIEYGLRYVILRAGDTTDGIEVTCLLHGKWDSTKRAWMVLSYRFPGASSQETQLLAWSISAVKADPGYAREVPSSWNIMDAVNFNLEGPSSSPYDGLTNEYYQIGNNKFDPYDVVGLKIKNRSSNSQDVRIYGLGIFASGTV
jgi:hypothetical protein